MENYALVAEELLTCVDGEDVVITESKVVLVKDDDERVDYARGYYHMARDELQEIGEEGYMFVFVMIFIQYFMYLSEFTCKFTLI